MSIMDTSAEAVEQLARYLDHDAPYEEAIASAMLRALLSRAERAEQERDEAIQRGNDWCDQAQKARAERDAAEGSQRGVPDRGRGARGGADAAPRDHRAAGRVGAVPAREDDVTNNPTGETKMIDQLTIAQVREIARMFGSQAASLAAPHPFAGRYVILRCHSAGVHAGWLVSQTGDQAVLRDSRRLWRWHAAGGIALSGVAVHGIVASKSKLDTTAPEIALTGVIETIPCSDVAQQSIANG